VPLPLWWPSSGSVSRIAGEADDKDGSQDVLLDLYSFSEGKFFSAFPATSSLLLPYSLCLGRNATMKGKLQMTLALIKPTVCSYQPDVSSVLKIIKNTPGLFVCSLSPSDIRHLLILALTRQAVRQKRLFWTQKEAEDFYEEHKGKFYYDRLIAGMTRCAFRVKYFRSSGLHTPQWPFDGFGSGRSRCHHAMARYAGTYKGLQVRGCLVSQFR
jgi:hypothetical protein